MNPSIPSRIGVIGAGYTINFLINNGFDYCLYIPIIAFTGPFWGCGIMIILSFFLNFSLIRLYDKTGKDWLGFELIKEGKGNLSAKLPKLLQKIVAAGDIGAFVCLSLYDPFMAVIFLRKQEQAYKGLSARDWKIFLAAVVLSNIGWTGLIFGSLSGLQWLFKTVHLAS